LKPAIPGKRLVRLLLNKQIGHDGIPVIPAMCYLEGRVRRITV
jgi:hypothetical protein